MTKFTLPCNGNSGDHHAPKAGTVTFDTGGQCKFTAFAFETNNPNGYPPGFSNRQPKTGGGPSISYDYDGTPIPATGYRFDYWTDSPMKGNGTGVIKN